MSIGGGKTLDVARPLTEYETQSQLHPGDLVGRYIVLGSSGDGGMGAVYSAHDQSLDRRVALKLLHPTRRNSGRARLRLHREAQALARVSHPNVVAVHDVGEYGSQVFVAMEFVDGITLRRWLEIESRSWSAVLDVFLAAGRGLAAVHERGLLHRDFKPENVMIDGTGRVVVMDLGLACMLEGSVASRSGESVRDGDAQLGPTVLEAELTVDGALVGTPAYVSPEQHGGAQADERADQFAFCVSLWEALYREHPFGAESLEELFTAVLMGSVRPVPAGSRVPRWLKAIVLRGLLPGPEQRWPNMLALLAALSKGRSRTRRRAASATVLGGFVLAGGWLGIEHSITTADCDAEGRTLEHTWNAETSAAIATAFERSGVGYASAVWASAGPRLDGYAERWRWHREQACLSGERDGTLGEAMLQRSRACFDDRAAQLALLVEQWRSPDPTIINQAGRAAWSLPEPAACLDEGELRHRELADDPAIAAVQTAVRRGLAESDAFLGTAQYEAALARADRAWESAESLDQPRLRAAVLLKRGYAKVQLARLDEATTDIELAYTEAERAGDDRQLLEAMTQMALLAYRRAEHDEALHWCWLAERKQDRLALPPDHPELARALNTRAAIYTAQGRYEDGAAAAERAIGMFERSLGPDHPDVAAALVNVGNARRMQGRLDQALVSHRRGLEIFERSLGKDHPHVAVSLYNVGIALVGEGRFDEGLEVHRRALGIAETALGASHPEVATHLGTLGDIHLELARYDEALAAYQRSLSIRREALGAEHASLAKSFYDLGNVHLEQGRYDEALAAHQRGHGIAERALGPDHLDVGSALLGIGWVHQAAGRFTEALAAHTRAFEIYQQGLGDEHPDLAAPLRGMGLAHASLGEFDEGMELVSRALAASERGLGTDHPDTADQLHALGHLHAMRGEPEAALPHLARALDIRERKLGDSHPDVARTLTLVGTIHRARNGAAEASAVQRRALEIFARTLPSDHPHALAVGAEIEALAGSEAKSGR